MVCFHACAFTGFMGSPLVAYCLLARRAESCCRVTSLCPGQQCRHQVPAGCFREGFHGAQGQEKPALISGAGRRAMTWAGGGVPLCCTCCGMRRDLSTPSQLLGHRASFTGYGCSLVYVPNAGSSVTGWFSTDCACMKVNGDLGA